MPEGTGGNVLVVDNVTKRFKHVEALKGIDFVIDGPGVYGFLGPNGAGKSTTFKIACGLLKPTSGRVLIDGTDVSVDTRKAVGDLGVQFDASPFYPFLSGRDNLQLLAKWHDTPVPRERIDRLLTTVDLADSAGRAVRGYSWGMRQRLGLAAALLNDPKLLILDEPTNGLDPEGIVAIRKLLPKLAGDEGKSILLSSHRMSEVEQVCDHVTIINEGTIVASGSPADLSGEANVLEVQCSEAPRAAELVAALDGVVKAEVVGSGRIEVLAPTVKASRINQYLVEQGIEVEQVVRRRESLEDVFFRLTGARDGETAEAPQ